MAWQFQKPKAREERGKEQQPSPGGYIDWLLGTGKDLVLEYFKNPTKENLQAIYKDFGPNGRYRHFVPESDHELMLVLNLVQYAIENDRKKLDEVMFRFYIAPLGSLARAVTGDERWIFPQGMPKTYAAVEVWFRTLLRLPIPEHLKKIKSQLEDKLKDPPKLPGH